MSADTKHADLLRRLADKIIRDLKPNDDPLCNISDDLFPDLVRAVVHGIVALVPDRPASAAKLKPMGGCDADTGH